MAVTTSVLSGTIDDLIGSLDPKYLARLVLVVESNTTGSTLIDTSGNRHLAGAKRVTIDKTTGAYSVTLVRTNSADIVPSTGRLYRATLIYPSGTPGSGNQTVTSGWFTLTADASLADVWTGIETVLVPASADLDDVAMTAVDVVPSSAFRVQQDARQAGLYAARASNLSDLASAATARTNLGLGTAAPLNVPAAGDAAAGEVVKGSDTRLTNARTPSAHVHAAADVTSGVFPIARLATGTPDGTKFVRDDGTLAVPAGGGTANASRLTAAVTNATTTYAATGLSVTLAAGKAYKIRASGQWQTANSVHGIGIRLNGTATAVGTRHSINIWGTATSASTPLMVNASALATANQALSAVGAGIDYLWEIDGLIRCNAAGTLVVEFASESTSTITISADSFLHVTELP